MHLAKKEARLRERERERSRARSLASVRVMTLDRGIGGAISNESLKFLRHQSTAHEDAIEKANTQSRNPEERGKRDRALD